MAWLWNSWEEFVRYVQPVALQRNRFQHSCHATELELLHDLLEAAHDLRKATGDLDRLGFDEENVRKAKDEKTLHEAHNKVIDAVYAGEALLLFHKRLTLTEASYGFLHAHDILEHWDRYAANTRISKEIHQFIKDADLLVQGYDRLLREDERLLVDDLELPDELKQDFYLARNLFSIGLDDVGLFIAGRGLEKMLRQIAKAQKIVVTIRNKSISAGDAEFFDLIEALSRVRWKTRDVPLIPPETKALLHYLRSLRNRGAHTGGQGTEVEGAREKACVVAMTAAQLWKSVDGNRTRVSPTALLKDW